MKIIQKSIRWKTAIENVEYPYNAIALGKKISGERSGMVDASVIPVEWMACEDRWNTKVHCSLSVDKLMGFRFSEIWLNCQRKSNSCCDHEILLISKYILQKTISWKGIEKILDIAPRASTCKCTCVHTCTYAYTTRKHTCPTYLYMKILLWTKQRYKSTHAMIQFIQDVQERTNNRDTK